MRRARSTGLLLAVGCLASCGAEAPQGTPSPSIVLITSDSLRRDHLGCYGYFRDTTPRLDAFAGECVLFERALASMATTLPSHLTMLTGLYAHQHGMLSNQHAARRPFRSQPGSLSVAQVLADAGYDTAAFVSSAPLAASTGIAAGFATYSEPDKRFRKGKRTVRESIEWLDARDPDRPFFLWVHLWEPHDPNRPPEPYASLFVEDPRLETWFDELGIDDGALREAFASVPAITERFLGEGATIDRARLLDAFDRYDADVRYVDDCVGDLLDALRDRGLLERSLVAFTGDHGQALGEHAWLGHARILDVNLFVPLLMRFPTGMQAPRRIPGLVSLADLMPTLIARLPGDFSAYLEQAEGEDCLAPGFGRGFVLAQQTERELHLPRHSGLQFALYEDHWKLVQRPGQAPRLHDLAQAGEVEDVGAAHPRVLERLRTRLQALLARRPHRAEDAARSGQEVDGFLEALRELGYTGGE